MADISGSDPALRDLAILLRAFAGVCRGGPSPRDLATAPLLDD